MKDKPVTVLVFFISSEQEGIEKIVTAKTGQALYVLLKMRLYRQSNE